MQQANHGPRCELCKSQDHRTGHCLKYDVDVGLFYECDSWERDWSLPVKAV